MYQFHRFLGAFCISLIIFVGWNTAQGQDLPPRYATLELFTNTPCPVCGSQNPGLFSRLEAYEGLYHLVSFYPGKPYSSCIFYQANIAENTTRLNFYPQVFGTPTVAINGTQFRSSGSVSNSVLDGVTGGESWLHVKVEETFGNTRTVTITLEDHVGGSLESGRLFAVIVEREIMYNAPNGETLHHNVFRKFLTNVNGVDVDLSSGMATKTYQYVLDLSWQPDETYVIAWLMDPDTKEIYNSGTKYDPDFTSATGNVTRNTALDIYPNPASSEINITLPEDVRDAPLTIFNAGGQLIYEQVPSGDAVVRINTGVWPTGSYHVEVRLDDKVLIGRFEVVR